MLCQFIQSRKMIEHRCISMFECEGVLLSGTEKPTKLKCGSWA